MKSLSERLTHRELLQRGDLTLCYRARDAVLDRPVFVKVLHPALADDAEIRARFEREAKAVARLDHPNLVRIYEYGEDPQEGMYMVLEWVEGTTLAHQIADGKKFAGDEFMQVARELLSGLAALHGVGILHRDLKPENVLTSQQADKLTSRNRNIYKITDFSLAMLRDAPKLTHHEAIVGTPAYMAPEQASGGKPTERSDLFSLGVMLYEATTGTNPLIGETMLDTLRRIRESDVSFEHSAIAALSVEGRTLLERLLKKEPSERPASADDALTLLAGRVPRHEKLAPRSRKRDIRFMILAAIVLVIGVKLILDTGKKETSNIKPQTSKPATISDSSGQTNGVVEERTPEFRSPSTLDTNNVNEGEQSNTVPAEGRSEAAKKQAHEDPPLISSAGGGELTAITPDSIDLTLTTEPWAHVFFKGTQLGTTPLPAPLRVPSGAQTFELRNPAFPPVELNLSLTGTTQEEIRLTDYVTTVRTRVEPWGELYIDGEHIGTTPLTHPVYISPGRHLIRISHPKLPAVQRDVQTAAGESLDIEANLKESTLNVAMDAGDSR